MTFFTSDSDASSSDDNDLSESVATELNRLLADWALPHRLSETEIASVRANVLAAVNTETPVVLDSDWLWSLLRPVTALLDDAGDVVTSGFSGRGRRGWPLKTDTNEDSGRALVRYLQLA
jgi:hypothetical protein